MKPVGLNLFSFCYVLTMLDFFFILFKGKTFTCERCSPSMTRCARLFPLLPNKSHCPTYACHIYMSVPHVPTPIICAFFQWVEETLLKYCQKLNTSIVSLWSVVRSYTADWLKELFLNRGLSNFSGLLVAWLIRLAYVNINKNIQHLREGWRFGVRYLYLPIL